MDKIKLLFNMYKEKVIVSKKFKGEVQKKYNLSSEEARNLFVRIQNYQIEKYGNRLTHENKGFAYSEIKDISRRAIQRHYYKRKHMKEPKVSLDNYFGDVMSQIDDLCNQAKKISN